MIKSIKFRIKDKNKGKVLDLMARDVNFVWNVLNAASRKKWKESRQYFHKYDPYFNQIINGASSELKLTGETIQAIRDQFHKDIKQHGKQLRFKGRKSTKWIPFKRRLYLKDGFFIYKKQRFNIWQSMKIKGNIKSGSFTRDVTGRWFVNITYDCTEIKKSNGTDNVGIDLGLKTTAVCSNGKTLDVNDLKIIDKEIGKQQRARNFKRAKALYVKKTNIKKDRFNKFTLDLVKSNSLVVIGNVNGFTSGILAKSRYQNSWGILKGMLEFKCREYSIRYIEVDEYLTTQTCNICGSIEGPKGFKELSVRSWVCSCGAELNRDINAANNILKIGQSVLPPIKGITISEDSIPPSMIKKELE